jgi:hypothetical protein
MLSDRALTCECAQYGEDGCERGLGVGLLHVEGVQKGVHHHADQRPTLDVSSQHTTHRKINNIIMISRSPRIFHQFRHLL